MAKQNREFRDFSDRPAISWPRVYGLDPEAAAKNEPVALEREKSFPNQINRLENTILWGTDDALPMRIINAVNASPTTTNCLDTSETFLRGSGFLDQGLMQMVIDKDGTTFWDFHTQLCQNMTLLKSFAVNFKYDGRGKITNSYPIGTETVRFGAPPDQVKTINSFKVNPYFGTLEYNKRFTDEYMAWNPKILNEQLATYGTKFLGQLYFYGVTRPPFKFYPVPKYWAGERWIRADEKISTYVDELLGNGFFQSVLLTMIGNPNEMSKNPRLRRKVTSTVDGKERWETTHTVGEEFNEQMSAQFSGVKRAGAAFVKWAKNKDDIIDLKAFPTNTNFEFFNAVVLNDIRMISLSTQVPALLANLPAALSSLGSGGDAIQNSISMMQSTVSSDKRILEGFYNNVMLPNLAVQTKARVKIKDFIPIKTQVQIQPHVWEWMNDNEKSYFIENNFTDAKIIRPVVVPGPATPIPAPSRETITFPDPTNPDKSNPIEPDQPEQVAMNDNLKSLNMAEINRIQKIVQRYNLSQFEPGNSKALTYDQAKQFLLSYGIQDEQVTAWLVKPEVEAEAV